MKLDITLIVIPYIYKTFDTIKNFIISEINNIDKYKNLYNKELDWNILKEKFFKEFELLKENPDEFEELKKIIENKNGICISDKYINTKHKLKVQCKNYHIFEINSNDLKRNRWCKLCSHNAPVTKDSINEIIKESGIIMLDDYIKSNTTYRFKCSNNHIFNSSWDNMKQRFKKGCRLC
jgi:hypothetical protein